MANIGTLTASIGGDLSGLDSALTMAERMLKGFSANTVKTAEKTEKSVESMGDTFKKVGKVIAGTFATGAGVLGFTRLYKSSELFRTSITKLGTGMIVLIKRFSALSPVTAGLLHNLHAMEAPMLNFIRGFGKAAGAFGIFSFKALSLGLVLKGLGGTLNFISGGATRVSKAFSVAGVATTALVLGLGVLVERLGSTALSMGKNLRASALSSVDAFAHLEQQMWGMNIALDGYEKRIGKASITTEELTSKIMELSLATGFAMDEMHQGALVMLDMAKVTGLTDVQILKLLERIADFAAVTDQDFLRTVIAVDQAFRGYPRMLQAVGVSMTRAEVIQSKFGKGLEKLKQGFTDTATTAAMFNLLMHETEFVAGKAASAVGETMVGAVRQLEGATQLMNIELGRGVAYFYEPFLMVWSKIAKEFALLAKPLLAVAGAIQYLGGTILQTIGGMVKWGAITVALIAGWKLLGFAVAGVVRALGIFGIINAKMVTSITMAAAASGSLKGAIVGLAAFFKGSLMRALGIATLSFGAVAGSLAGLVSTLIFAKAMFEGFAGEMFRGISVIRDTEAAYEKNTETIKNQITFVTHLKNAWKAAIDTFKLSGAGIVLAAQQIRVLNKELELSVKQSQESEDGWTQAFGDLGKSALKAMGFANPLIALMFDWNSSINETKTALEGQTSALNKWNLEVIKALKPMLEYWGIGEDLLAQLEKQNEALEKQKALVGQWKPAVPQKLAEAEVSGGGIAIQKLRKRLLEDQKKQLDDLMVKEKSLAEITGRAGEKWEMVNKGINELRLSNLKLQKDINQHSIEQNKLTTDYLNLFKQTDLSQYQKRVLAIRNDEAKLYEVLKDNVKKWGITTEIVEKARVGIHADANAKIRLLDEAEEKRVDDKIAKSIAAIKRIVDTRIELERSVTARINELTMSEYDLKILQLNEYIKALDSAGVKEGLITKLKNAEIAKLNEQATQNALEEYNKQAEAWNDTVDDMAGTFKSIFIETAQDEWTGFGDYFEKVMDRMKNTLLDTLTTMVSDWIAGMFKMQAASNINVTASGGIGAITGGGTAGVDGAGGTTTGSGTLATDVGKTIGTAAGKEITKPLLAGITERLGLSSVSGLLSGVGGGLLGGQVGSYVGKNVAATRGRATSAAVATPVASLAGGLAGYALGGLVTGGIGAIVGIIYALVSTLFGTDETKRRRQGMGSMFTQSLEGLRGGEYSSFGEFASAVPDTLRRTNYLKYAQQYQGLPQTKTGIEFEILNQGQEAYLLAQNVGGGAAATAGSLNVMTKEMEAYSMAIGARFPESAKKTQELIDKMKGLWKDDLLKRFDLGIGRLSAVRRQLKNMGMEDHETKVKLLDMAWGNLFNTTIPLGDIQLKRLFRDIKELTQELEDTESAKKGQEVLMAAITNGLELTNDELQKFTQNQQNLMKLEYLDIMEAMGLDKIELVAEATETFQDTIDAMRETLDRARASMGSYREIVEGLPASLNNVKEAMLEVAVATTWFMDIIKESIDVIENLGNFKEFWEDLLEAIEGGDLMALGDSLMDAAIAAQDLMEVSEMLAQTFNIIGEMDLAAVFEGISRAAMAAAIALEAVYGVLLFLKIIADVGKLFFEFVNELEKINEAMGWWTAFKEIVETLLTDLERALKQSAKDFSEWGNWIGDILSIVADSFGLVTEVVKDFMFWLLGISDSESTFRDIEDFLDSMKKISKETFKAMTVDLANYLAEYDRVSLDINLENMYDTFDSYLDYIKDNYDELVDIFGKDTVFQMIQNAADAYVKMINDMFDDFIEAFTDFQESIGRALQEMSKEGRTGEDIMADIIRVREEMEEARPEIKLKDIPLPPDLGEDFFTPPPRPPEYEFVGDPEEYLERAMELKELYVEWYNLEKARLTDLEALLERIGEFTKALARDINDVVMDEARFAMAAAKTADEREKAILGIGDAYQQQIDQIESELGGVTLDLWESFQEALESGDWDEVIENAEQYRNLLLERYDLEKRMIQETYGLQIQELEKIKSAYESLNESVSQQILGMQTSTDSPATMAERMGVQMGEITRLRDLADTQTGEERAGTLQELADALGVYLEMAQGEFARPSAAYQDIFNEVMTELLAIQTEAKTTAETADEQIIDLNNEMNIKLGEIATQLKTDLAWLEAIAGGVEKEVEKEIEISNGILEDIEGWLEDLLDDTNGVIGTLGSIRDLYISKIRDDTADLVTSLKNIEGTEVAAVGYLSSISGKLTDIYKQGKVVRGTPFAAGISFVPHDNYPAMLHRGEDVGRADQRGQEQISISFGDINMGGRSDVSAKKFVEELEHEINFGTLGKVIVEKVKAA